MITLLSPAKKLDFADVPESLSYPRPHLQPHSQPDFLNRSRILVDCARKLNQGELSRLMKISHKLAELNHSRFREFSTPFTPDNAKQAVFAFRGDTYVGLDADSFDEGDLDFAQDHLRILSGLYGLLRPLDLIQPYRLEMGSRLSNPQGGNLYEFWNGQLSESLNVLAVNHTTPLVVNLASREYFKALDRERLQIPVLTPEFKEWRNGEAKVIGMMAKRARGMMARYIIRNRLESPKAMKDFSDGGYTFQADQSDQDRWVFMRERP
jgi:cytoplasmic iron level regulating protein YaaA (DUF328/UPF0246 family)